MDHSCFIIMPPTEPSGYAQGHFNLVYDYVIVPACRAAGYWPTKSESITYENPMDVVKNIIDSEIVLCDLSAGNPNALYGLAVRQSLDLPVTLIKDLKSFVMFDAKEFGLVEYDESLRIDTVQKAIETLSAALVKAVETKKERHQLLNRLSIGLPQFTPSVEPEITVTTTFEEQPIVEEEQKPKETGLPKISPIPDYVGVAFSEDELGKLKAGDSLFHLSYGKGKMNFVKESGRERLASIQFESGTKLLVLVASDYFRKVK